MDQSRRELTNEEAAAQEKALEQNRQNTPPPDKVLKTKDVKAPKLSDGSDPASAPEGSPPVNESEPPKQPKGKGK